MLHLRTFGVARLTGDDGVPLEAVASQRRMLAVLSILAVNGENGISRERIVALLWPEGDSERGRSSLSQVVYSARKLLHCDSLFIASGDLLSLNPAQIVSDVGSFEAAVAAGHLEEAAYHYTAGFLDDFHVPGLAEFDRWIGSHRQRLRDAADTVFDALGTEAERRGDWDGAIEWRRRQSSIAPYNAVAAQKLAIALRNGGDRGGALHQLRLHAALLRADLEMEPDATVVALIEELKQEPPPAPVRATPDATPARRSPSLPNALRGTSRRRATTVAALAATIVAAMVLWHSQPPSPPPGDVLVAPFRTSGADRSLAFLQNGIIDLVADRLDGSGYGSVDAAAVRGAWRGMMPAVAEASAAQLLGIARRAGARRLVLGSIVGDSRHLIISANLLDVATGKSTGAASVEGTLDSLTSVVDQLAGNILVIEAGERKQFPGGRLPALAALRTYLKGQQAYRRGAYVDALHEYEKSLNADSTFALAALQLALASDRLNTLEQHERAVTIAWTHRARLSRADRRRLIAFAGPDYPGPSPRQRQLQAIESALRFSRDRADLLVEIAQRYIRLGAVLGADNPNARAQALLSRALQLNPDNQPARATLALATVAPSSTVTPASDPGETQLPAPIRWRLAVQHERTSELADFRREMSELPNEHLIQIARLSLFDRVAAADGELALRIWESRTDGEADRVDAVLAQHAMALNRGDAARALRLTGRLGELLPGTQSHLRLRVLDALYGGGDEHAAETAAAKLERSIKSPLATGEPEHASQLANMCVAGQWRLAHGDVTGIDLVVDRLRTSRPSLAVVRVAANARGCAELLRAWAAVESGASDATARLARLDSMALVGPAAGDAAAYAPIVIAQLYQRIGEPRRAIEALRRRPYLYGWPRYLATELREESALAATLGEKQVTTTAVSTGFPTPRRSPRRSRARKSTP